MSRLGLAIAVLLATGCGAKQEPPAKAAAAPAAAACPMMKDAQLAVTDGDHDVTITLTTQGDPTALRAHVHEMGAKHDHMAHGMMMGSGGMGMGSGGMHEHMAMVPSHAAVDDVDHGARIVLTPDDPAQLVALREHVHAHAEMMKSGHCPMMGAHSGP